MTGVDDEDVAWAPPPDRVNSSSCGKTLQSGYPKDKQVWLKPGDKLVTSIEKLGDLTFTLT